MKIELSFMERAAVEGQAIRSKKNGGRALLTLLCGPPAARLRVWRCQHYSKMPACVLELNRQPPRGRKLLSCNMLGAIFQSGKSALQVSRRGRGGPYQSLGPGLVQCACELPMRLGKVPIPLPGSRHPFGPNLCHEEFFRVRRVPPPLWIGPLCVDPPLLQAPMAGFTNYAYRQIVREFGGAGLQATEMVSARGFLRKDEDGELPDRLWGVMQEFRPLAVQIWDNNPDDLAAVGAKLAHEFRVSVVDINFGCPVKQVTERAHSGSYLLRYPDRVGQIVERVARACAPVPVTAKIRLGCTRDTVNAIDVAQVVEGAGGAALTVHGRTAQDFFQGSADWDRIAAIKPHLKRIPLIGNGDLDSPEKVVAAFERYPVDGVMIARAALAKPWLFRQAAAALQGEEIPTDPDPFAERDLLVRHYEQVVARFGVTKGTVLMRKFACCYAQGRPGAREFRTRVSQVSSVEEFNEIVARYFPTWELAGSSEGTADGEMSADGD